MLNRIKDIKCALESGAVLSALALSLVIPDICGKLENPNMGVGARYKAWFNNYVKTFNMFGQTNSPIKIKCNMNQPFDSEVCYKLRCAFLHSGDIDEIDIRDFKLTVDGKYSVTIGSYGGKVSVDIKMLCRSICNAAEKFYNDKKDNLDFSSIEICLD